jgi:hypothetical protein
LTCAADVAASLLRAKVLALQTSARRTCARYFLLGSFCIDAMCAKPVRLRYTRNSREIRHVQHVHYIWRKQAERDGFQPMQNKGLESLNIVGGDI